MKNQLKWPIIAQFGLRLFLIKGKESLYNKGVRSNKVKERGMCDV